MSDVICKHGWSRRFCEPCSQAHIIASLKGPGDKGMLANPPDDLVERVARALVSPKADPSDWRFWTDEARAAIAVVLEEAAKMLEARWAYGTADHQAAAIRALVKQSITEEERA